MHLSKKATLTRSLDLHGLVFISVVCTVRFWTEPNRRFGSRGFRIIFGGSVRFRFQKMFLRFSSVPENFLTVRFVSGKFFEGSVRFRFQNFFWRFGSVPKNQEPCTPLLCILLRDNILYRSALSTQLAQSYVYLMQIFFGSTDGSFGLKIVRKSNFKCQNFLWLVMHFPRSYGRKACPFRSKLGVSIGFFLNIWKISSNLVIPVKI